MCVIGFDSQPYFVRIPLLFSAKLHKAGIAQLVEHHLAKVEVASSSLVSRSIFSCYSGVSSKKNFFHPNSGVELFFDYFPKPLVGMLLIDRLTN